MISVVNECLHGHVTKHVTILVVTVADKGANPITNHLLTSWGIQACVPRFLQWGPQRNANLDEIPMMEPAVAAVASGNVGSVPRVSAYVVSWPMGGLAGQKWPFRSGTMKPNCSFIWKGYKPYF